MSRFLTSLARASLGGGGGLGAALVLCAVAGCLDPDSVDSPDAEAGLAAGETSGDAGSGEFDAMAEAADAGRDAATADGGDSDPEPDGTPVDAATDTGTSLDATSDAENAASDAKPDAANMPSDAAQQDADTGKADPIDAGCLKNVTDYFQPGPFEFEAVRGEGVERWVPEVPAGCKVPMVHLSVATGARCDDNYEHILEGLASHGFLALCDGPGTLGDGQAAIGAFEAALTEYPELADLKFGMVGHGAGGQGALVSMALARSKWTHRAFYAGLGLAPESGFGAQPEPFATWQNAYAQIRDAVLLLSGDPTDGLVSRRWVQDGFDALGDSAEAYHWSSSELDHIPVPQEVTLQLAVPWFRWKLLGDERACEALRAVLEMDDAWELAAEQNASPCATAPRDAGP